MLGYMEYACCMCLGTGKTQKYTIFELLNLEFLKIEIIFPKILISKNDKYQNLVSLAIRNHKFKFYFPQTMQLKKYDPTESRTRGKRFGASYVTVTP